MQVNDILFHSNVLQAHSYDEIEEFQQVATGLVVNVGTLTSDWVASMQLAAKTANSLGKPWVLDPVGAGATAFRTKVLTFPRIVNYMSMMIYMYCPIFACLSARQLQSMLWSVSLWKLLHIVSHQSMQIKYEPSPYSHIDIQC